MGCCDKAKSTNDIYVPLNQRLIQFAIDNTEYQLRKKFPTTKLYIFSFADFTKSCGTCHEKFSEMVNWFHKYGVLENPINNVKWIFEDDMSKNLIADDIGLGKSPTHLFCDSNGNIIDIVPGFPSEEWLEKYILPLVTN